MTRRRTLTVFAAFLIACCMASPAMCGNPSGRWIGSWTSQTSGHTGPLRARIRQVDSDTYRALFAGRFAVVVPFVYPAKLDRVPGTFDLYRSNTRLPLMGNYGMTARISGGRFNAVYSSKSDRGVFRMNRR